MSKKENLETCLYKTCRNNIIAVIIVNSLLSCLLVAVSHVNDLAWAERIISAIMGIGLGWVFGIIAMMFLVNCHFKNEEKSSR